MAAAIDGGDIETVGTCSGTRIDIRELAEQALHVWPVVANEEALGREASLILPPGVRTRRFAARLPRYLIAALRCLAEENGESVEALLTRELHGLAWTNRARLAAAIPGFAEAANWPGGEDMSDVSQIVENECLTRRRGGRGEGIEKLRDLRDSA
jgi:hypothetical protein